MPPHNLFDSDCQSGPSVSQFFNSFLSTSLNTLTPMCNDSAVSPMCNDSPGDVDDDIIATTSSMGGVGGCNNDNSGMSYNMSNMTHHSMSHTTTSPLSSSSTYNSSKARSPRSHHHSLSVATNLSVDPRRPPLNPIKPTPKTSSYRNRKKFGLSVNIPPPNSDPHKIPSYGGYPPPISCSTNVELRRKSLSERHFFRPVSEDEESVRMGKVNQ